MSPKVWRWVLGLTYIFAVASIWIAASFVVQTVVDAGVSPFLITYMCNSLFVVYIPLVVLGRYLEDNYGGVLFWRSEKAASSEELRESEKAILLGEKKEPSLAVVGAGGSNPIGDGIGTVRIPVFEEPGGPLPIGDSKAVVFVGDQVDAKGRWTHYRMAKVSLLICPFWFLAQLTFNLSLKYTTVTSNTILSSASSLFTFLVSLAFLGEKFTWVKLISVLLCMGGTIIVSLGDTETVLTAVASKPLLGDIFALVSAALYAVYITLIRKKLSDEDEKSGSSSSSSPSMAQFLGFLGLFNLIIFLPVVLLLNFSGLERFSMLSWKQFGLIIGKGLLDNVLSDYLWAKAVLLTTTTVATAGLTIQVPMAAIVDSVIGNPIHLMDYLGAVAVMVGFAGINIPSDTNTISECRCVKELESGDRTLSGHEHECPHRQPDEIVIPR